MKYGFLPKIYFHKLGGLHFFWILRGGTWDFWLSHWGATNFGGYFAAFPSSPSSAIFNERSPMNFWYHVCLCRLNSQTNKLMEKVGLQGQVWFLDVIYFWKKHTSISIWFVLIIILIIHTSMYSPLSLQNCPKNHIIFQQKHSCLLKKSAVRCFFLTF